MNRTVRGLQKIALLLLSMALALLIWANYAERRSPWAVGVTPPLPSFTPKPDITPHPNMITLPQYRAEHGESLVLAVGGDVVVHSGLNAQAMEDGAGEYDYSKIFEGAAAYFKAADISIVNLETVLAGDDLIAAYPMFRSPDAIAGSLSNSGVNFVNTAGNHCMDGFKTGLDRTLNVIEAAGMRHIGTYRTQAERDRDRGIAVIEANGIKIAFLSYTYGTNGMPLYSYDSKGQPVESFEYAVSTFSRDYMEIQPKEPRYDLLRMDMEAAKNIGADLIAVMMHWGTEYETAPNRTQTDLADFLFMEGADIILGSHPHVLQPMELRRVTDSDGKERIGFIIYSLGNFVSCMHERKYADLTAILNIEIEKNLDTGETYIWNLTYAPMCMVDLGEESAIKTGVRYRLWDIHSALDGHESGESELDEARYEKLLAGLANIHDILGQDSDYYYR